jgi:hypothetical protein
MANVFEQLENLDSVSEPRQAFEDIVTSILLDCGYTDGRVKVFRGDGGIDAFKGSLAKGGKLTVYQSKYFTGPWGDSQKQQIRESFASVKKDFQLKKWFLCTPSRPTKEDLRWFDTWRKKQGVPIELIDGDDLVKMLNAPCASRARQRLRDWGVLSVPGGASIVQTEARVVTMDATHGGPAFRCMVFVKNQGDVTAEDVRITFRHSTSYSLPGSFNEVFWTKLNTTMFDVRNPITLQAKFGLHPGEGIELLQIPLGSTGASPFPFAMSIEYWIKNQRSGRQSLVIEKPPVDDEITFQFGPGETETPTSPGGGFVLIDLEYPSNGILENLLNQIAGHPYPTQFGFVDAGRDAAQPEVALYRAHLSSGTNQRMSRESLTWALAELVRLGWLQPLDPTGGQCRYLLTDAAKSSAAFIKQVEYYKSLRERPR